MTTYKINPMGKELFGAVEGPQGFAFISDAVEEYASDEDILAVAESALNHSRAVVEHLEKFVKKHRRRLKKLAVI